MRMCVEDKSAPGCIRHGLMLRVLDGETEYGLCGWEKPMVLDTAKLTGLQCHGRLLWIFSPLVTVEVSVVSHAVVIYSLP